MLDYVRLVLALLRRRERREVNEMSGVSRVFVAFTSLLACGVRRTCHGAREAEGEGGGYENAQAVYYNVFSFKMTSCHFLLINGFPFLFFPISRTRRRT